MQARENPPSPIEMFLKLINGSIIDTVDGGLTRGSVWVSKIRKPPMRHIIQHQLFAALPFLALSTVGATAETAAPRHWVDDHAHHRLHNGLHGRALYGHEHGTVPARWNGCGVYHYFSGEQCVDARDVAPKS